MKTAPRSSFVAAAALGFLVASNSALGAPCGKVGVIRTWTPELGHIEGFLRDTGRLESVEYLPYQPWDTLEARLARYDAVLVSLKGEIVIWDAEPDNPYAGRAALGDVLADYADSGSGIVTTVGTHSFNDSLDGTGLLGRFPGIIEYGGGPSYAPLHSKGNGAGADSTAMSVVLATSLFSNVGDVHCGVPQSGGPTPHCTRYTPTRITLDPESTVLAQWGDGDPAVVQKANVIAFNAPSWSSAAEPTGWDAASDMDVLLANALLMVSPSCQGDGDLDGLSAAEEAAWGTDDDTVDFDGDRLQDGDEVTLLHTDPAAADTDGDGTPDGAEDSDGDGLSDADELYVLGTDPLDVDSDDDGTADGDEDADGDGLSNAAELTTHHTSPILADTDGDGLTDGEEAGAGTSPLTDDTDGDLVADGLDACPTEPGGSVDQDGDGCPDEVADTDSGATDDTGPVTVRGGLCSVGPSRSAGVGLLGPLLLIWARVRACSGSAPSS